MCTNLEGSFECVCNPGFTLVGLARDTCSDHDECALNPTICGTNGTCINQYGSYRCSCQRGFQIDSTTGVCVDIDECRSGRFGFNLCNNGRCVNQPGSTDTYSLGCGYGKRNYSQKRKLFLPLNWQATFGASVQTATK